MQTNVALSDLSQKMIEVISSEQDELRNQSLDQLCAAAGADDLLRACEGLEHFRRTTDNLYFRVRALFFLYAIHRFHLPPLLAGKECGSIPFTGYTRLLGRRFNEAVRDFLSEMAENGPSVTISSALATAYHRLAFQTLADQVRKSVRQVKGNQWMFRAGHPADLPLRLRGELLTKSDAGAFPVLVEHTSVRMDFSHSGWSDIFFLGMDYPEGARVINASVDLAVEGKHDTPEPPIEAAFRVIDEPVLRLVSIDLGAKADIRTLAEVFDFGRDYLGLLKAAVIASGLIPPGLEGCDQGIESVLQQLVAPGKGIEIVSRVNDIPKGSRLAVSTNLLGALISVCMRATRQVSALTGELTEEDRRIVAARAILGEWIGGSGGGWQDSGGVWPGIKLIQGCASGEGDPEYGVSRGRLLPSHHVFDEQEISSQTREKLQDSLVLVHGGMAQNVGPILEMVTEKYLLRCEQEWEARQEAISILEKIQAALRAGDLQQVGALTTENFLGPLQKIIPWCSNRFTEDLIHTCKQEYGLNFWGFWMLGGMAGGGMGFLFDPKVKVEAAKWLHQQMVATKREQEKSLPFAMDPVVYQFRINDRGTVSELRHQGPMPKGYYELIVPDLLRKEMQSLTEAQQLELQYVSRSCRATTGATTGLAANLLDRILPAQSVEDSEEKSLDHLLHSNGFDQLAHEHIREDIRQGRLGLPQNRLPANSTIEDVFPEDVLDARRDVPESLVEAASDVIASGQVAVMTLAAGVGSRWTEGAGVVKALHPFAKFDGSHRTFLDVHLAKSRKVGQQFGHYPSHIVSTGYLTDAPIRSYLDNLQYDGQKIVSQGKSVGLRMVPTIRDLRFAWEEMPQQVLDEQQEKLRLSGRAALMEWAKECGEAADYRANKPMQCMHPVGHWYEIPNLLRNGVLRDLLAKQPELRHLLLHNVDTLGATIDPRILALHMTRGACLSFEVITRRLEDRGGGLARVDGRPRLVEGLAMPSEEEEFKLSYYNSMTTWIDIDRLLEVFGLSRGMLDQQQIVDDAIRRLGRRMPTYITLKDVKKRWGNGQEDVFPVAQFEKLWGDMSALAEVDCQFIVVPTVRGQQLKEQGQLDAWVRDGSAAEIESLCAW